MEDNNNKTTIEEKKEIDLLEEIEKLKQNSVSREEYEKLKNEKNEIVKRFLNGENNNTDTSTFSKNDADRIAKQLTNPDNIQTNYDFWNDVLKLRDYHLDKDGRDIFLTHSNASEEDREKAEEIATTIREIIDVSEGDRDVFNRELNRILKSPAFVKN